MSHVSVLAVVTRPPQGTWSTYLLTACETAAPTACVTGTPPCTVATNGPGGGAMCDLAGLSAGTQYNLTAVAQAAGVPDTLPSAPIAFTTKLG